MKNIILISILAIFFTMGSFAQTKGSGNVKSEDRSVDNFSSIKLSCSADLIITQGKTAITVRADDNLLQFVETEVENGVLNVGIKGRGFRSAKVIEVHITVPSLEKIQNSGSGDIRFTDVFKTNDLYVNISGSGDLDADFNVTNLELRVNGSGDTDLTGVMGMLKISVAGSGDIEAEGLKLDECNVKNSGSGDITLKGKANRLTVSQNGSGDMNAYNLTTVSAIVSNSGSADIALHVVEDLKITLNGSGDLVYTGDPQRVDVRSNGSGEVYKK